MQFPQILRRYTVHLLLTAIVLLAYWPVYKNAFVYDDVEYITNNQHVQHGLMWSEIRWSLTSAYASNWHPLTWISHMADGRLYGPNPAGHHVTSLLFHLANVLLLFILLSKMTGSVWPSAFVAALFGVHPLHVESVAWIAERKDVLSTFFWLLTMLAYTRYARGPNLKNYALVVGLFILGLASKPMLVTLPFVLLLMDYWPLERFKKLSVKRLMIEKLPLLLLAAGSCVITYRAQQQGGAMGTAEVYPMGTRIPNALAAYIAYLAKMLWPTRLAVFYPHPGRNLPLWEAVGAGMALVLMTVLAIRAGRKRPYLAVGWLWYVGTLVPVIGLVQVGNQAMADRYTYVPLIGLFIALTWGIADWLGLGEKKKRKKKERSVLVPGVAGAIVLALIILTRLQLRYWQDDIQLYQHALDVTKNNYVAHINMGAVLADTDPEEGIAHYQEALRIKPDSFIAHHNLGSALARQGQLDEAIRHYRLAIKYNPKYSEAYNNLGTALMNQGKTDEAYLAMTEALKINPRFAEAHNNLGMLLDNQGQANKAIVHFQDAIAINPEFAQAHYNYGICLGRLGKARQAIEEYQTAIELDPTFGPAHLNLAIALYFLKDYEAAWREVHLAQENGSQPNFDFLRALSQKMPEPR